MDNLLHRQTHALDFPKEYYRDKTIMITGAGGFIGSRLCQQLCSLQAKLLFVDQHEASLHKLYLDTPKSEDNEFFLLNVCDQDLLRSVFRQYCPEIVFHLASYKNIEFTEIEHNHSAVIRNNLLSTRAVGLLSKQFGVETFLFTSSDKAFSPTSVMGESKLICEQQVRKLAGGKDRFLIVRFGNVFGSSGSVIDVYEKAGSSQKAIPLTHPAMKRYFLSPEEACSLLLWVGACGDSGRIYMLDTGQEVYIQDIADYYAKQYSVPVKVVGVRPGEKLFEAFPENLLSTQNPRIFVLPEEDLAG